MLRNRIYYNLKPFIPKVVRMLVRSRLASKKRARVRKTWPIMPGSERPPDGWPGWPNGRKFAVVLTHDIEGKAGLLKCRRLMHLEQDLGFRSSFGFIPEGSYDTPLALREDLTRNGFEVGVHDLQHDGRLYRSQTDFLRKADRINHYLSEWRAAGFRSGFMLRNLDWLHALNLKYDMSTFDTDPFEPQADGCHSIFPFFVSPGQRAKKDFASRRAGYVELPYTLPQDSTLFFLLREKSPQLWLHKLDWVASHGGMVLVDTHPDYMAFDKVTPQRFEYPVVFYEKLLQHIRTNYEGQYWHALPQEVANHVLTHRLVQEDVPGPPRDQEENLAACDLENVVYTDDTSPND